MKGISRTLALVVLFAAGGKAFAQTGTTDVIWTVFEDCCGGVTNEVRRLSAAEASRVLDETYARDGRYAGPVARRRLKRLLSEGLGEMFTFETFKPRDRIGRRHMRHYWLVHRMADVTLPAYDTECFGFATETVFGYDKAEHPVACPTNVVAWGTSGREKHLRPLVDAVRSFAVATSRVETVVREVVADVENVRLVSLTDLDGGMSREDEDVPDRACANYRVTLRVRKVLKGTDDFVRFDFPVVWGDPRLTPDKRWLFYRGITLAVGFATVDGAERVVRIDPVLPYPPYAREKIGLFGSAEEVVEAENPFAPLAKAATNDVRSLFVDYAGHTFVQYAATMNLIAGCFGRCPDFSATTCIRVRTDGAAARPDYWRDAWFGYDGESNGWQVEEKAGEYDGNEVRPRASVLPALACLASEDVLPFAWRGIRFPSVSFRPPATMTDVAEFFTLATKPFCETCPSHHFRVQVEPAAAQRVVRPYQAENILAVEALSNICSRCGCAFAVEGTNVTIRAVLEDDECRPPEIAILTERMKGLGFADVRPAYYGRANINTPLRGDGFWEKEEAVFAPYRPWPGASGNTWLMPHADTNRVLIVAFRCIAWNVAQVGLSTNREVKVSFDWVRLERDIAKLVFALEEGEPVDKVAALAFALQIFLKGYEKQGERIVELLWQNPVEAKTAMEALRQRILDMRRLYSTPEEWLSAMSEELGEDKLKDDEEDDDED